MKKHMRFAAMLASAAMLCSAIPATPVSALWWWGTSGGNEFQDMIELDDKGLFKWVGYGGNPDTQCDYQVYTYHYSYDKEIQMTYADTGETKTELHHFEGDPVYVVSPRENVLRIVLRKELDHDEAEQKMFEILEHYYPGIRSTESTYYSIYQVTEGVSDLECCYDLYDNSKAFATDEPKTAGSPEISAAIMHDLAEAGVISAFYTWGQTAKYQQVTLQSKNASPTAYYPTSHKWNSDTKTLEEIIHDWDAVKAWVQAHHPECEFVRVTLDNTELAKKIGYYDSGQERAYFGNYDEMYAVIPPDGTAFPEHFAIAAELYAEFGIASEWLCPESATSPLVGQNAIAVAGDLNIDGKVTVADAVMLARVIAEDATVTVTDAGLLNADLNASGAPDQEDLTLILKQLAGIK